MGNSESVTSFLDDSNDTDSPSSPRDSSIPSSPSGTVSSGKERPTQPTTTKYTERDECPKQRISCAVSGMKGWRPTMEDQHLYEFSLNIRIKTGPDCGEVVSLHDHSIFAVFDGHGGTYTSDYLKKNFVKVLSLRPEFQEYIYLPRKGPNSRADVNGVTLLKNAVHNTFIKIDDMLSTLHKSMQNRNEREQQQHEDESNASSSSSSSSTTMSPMERSGSTAVVVVLTPHHILCANTGDSRAILQRHGKVVPLSFDHKPNNVAERRRIQQANGYVKRKRVDGDLAVSRAFGDFCLKQASEPPQKVIVDPDILIYPRDLSGDEFIVLACDGVWDVATNEMCCEYVQKLLWDGEINLGNICEEALDTCLERKSRDNMTMMLVGLPALKADRSSQAQINNALWGQRITRQYQNITNVTMETAEKARAAITAQVNTTIAAL
jgi:serine/threonine protein phosphatase PrpC